MMAGDYWGSTRSCWTYIRRRDSWSREMAAVRILIVSEEASRVIEPACSLPTKIFLMEQIGVSVLLTLQ